MSSDLESTLVLLKTNDYASVVLLTAVLYDYILTFSKEVEYIWHRPWSWVSTVFVLVRYVGLCWIVTDALAGSTFAPGPVEVIVWHRLSLSNVFLNNFLGAAFYLIGFWGFSIFLAAADLVMVLRVYAMWNRSKRILYVLLFIYVTQVVVYFVIVGIYDNPNTYLSVTTVQFINYSFCYDSWHGTPSRLDLSSVIPRFVLGAVLLVLAVIRTLKEAVSMYKATKRWQPNRYIQHLARDGIIYYLVNLYFNIASMLQDAPSLDSTTLIFVNLVAYMAMYPMMPRFIISVRELYDRDLRGQVQRMDTGFGVGSQHVDDENAVISTIGFADDSSAQDQIEEENAGGPEVFRLEVVGNPTAHPL